MSRYSPELFQVADPVKCQLKPQLSDITIYPYHLPNTKDVEFPKYLISISKYENLHSFANIGDLLVYPLEYSCMPLCILR